MPDNLYGRWSPWAWGIEPVNGCNLRCGHCAQRLFPKGVFHYMAEETWMTLFKIIRRVTPRCRVEMALAGEPLLHPDMLELLRIARELSPESQLQITTNGTQLLRGEYKYADLLKAGANIIYTDMYGEKEDFCELAAEAGVMWYDYHEKPKDAPGAWSYHGPDLKLIVLMDPPKNWPDKRKSLGRLGTWYNNLDWEAAKEFNMVPVVKPPHRRCTQPYVYSVTDWKGRYLFCCQDMMGETAGTLGDVSSGVMGFKSYWFSKKMQHARRELRENHRENVSECARCSITFSRCDMRMWLDNPLNKFWDGHSWKKMEE